MRWRRRRGRQVLPGWGPTGWQGDWPPDPWPEDAPLPPSPWAHLPLAERVTLTEAALVESARAYSELAERLARLEAWARAQTVDDAELDQLLRGRWAAQDARTRVRGRSASPQALSGRLRASSAVHG